MKTVIAWITTIPFLFCFGMILLFFDIAGRIVRPFSLRAFEWTMGYLQWTLLGLYRIFGTRIEVERPADVLPRTAYAILSNHQSLLDIVMIGGTLVSNFPKYVAKKELGAWIPSVSLNLKWGQHALIDRDDPRQAVRAIKEMAHRAQERDVSACIFPEGKRSRDGHLLPFKTAGAKVMLKEAGQLPVVPAIISGSWRLNRVWPFRPGSRVLIRFGSPIARTPGDETEVLNAVETWMNAQLQPAESGKTA